MKGVEERSYDPETIELMRTVLDEAWGLLEPKQRASTNKTEIAVRILNFGSKADMATLIGDVRYTPKSGQTQRRSVCPLCASSDHSHRSKLRRYSITLSAVKSSLGGISRPKVVAVLRLMKSENLLPAWIGRSPGLAPLRMRST